MKKFYFIKENNFYKAVEKFNKKGIMKKMNEAAANYFKSFNPNDKYNKEEIFEIIRKAKEEGNSERINEYIKNNINNKTALAYLDLTIINENSSTILD